MRHALPVEQAPDDTRRLVQPVQPLAEARTEFDAERIVLALEPTAAEAEHRATAGLVVERGRQLGDQPRIPERRRRHEQAEADACRDRRHGRERRPALELRIGPVGLVRQEVVVEPERVPAGAFDGQAGVAEIGPVGALDPESRPEPHARASRRVTTGTGTPGSRARTRSPGCRAARGSRPRRPTTAARTRCPCSGTGRPSGGPADSRAGPA